MNNGETPEKGIPNKNNPHGLTQADFVTVRNTCMIAGAPLQRFKPGGLDECAKVIERDLANAKTLLLSSINRRRGEKLAKMLRAAETFRQACADYALIMDIADPAETPANE